SGLKRSRPKPGRPSRLLLRRSPPPGTLADRFRPRFASRSPPTSTATPIPYTAVLAAWSRCAMAACCWDGREEDAPRKIVRAPCWKAAIAPACVIGLSARDLDRLGSHCATNSLRRHLPGEQQWHAELVGKGLADQHGHGLRPNNMCWL